MDIRITNYVRRCMHAVIDTILRFQWHDNDQYHEICDIHLKKWYNITLNVNCHEQTFEGMVNSEKYEGTFRHYQDNVNTIRTNGWRDQPEWTSYLDQIILFKKS